MSDVPADPLSSLKRKMQVVCDHATAVALGFKNGIYL